jgi:two-component system chemotaxis family response regulator WspR
MGVGLRLTVDRETKLGLLRGTMLLAPLESRELDEFLAACHERSLSAGQTLCREGEPGRSMYVVLAGHLVVSIKGNQVAVEGPGDCVGEMALIQSRERSATVRAREEALVLEIPEAVFRTRLAPNPTALMALLRIFSERVRNDLDALASDNVALQAYATEVERNNQALTEVRRQLEDKNRLLERLSSLDTLTGIANRRRFDAALRQEWRRSSREESPLSLLFCDIDYFKSFNDTYGHQAGDACLVRVAHTMQESLNRPADLAARYGGEEFVALLVDTEREGARLLAERIRERIESLHLEHRASTVAPVLTVSLGVATSLPRSAAHAEDLVRWADRALYRAKHGGRNRVALADESKADRPGAASSRPRAGEDA